MKLILSSGRFLLEPGLSPVCMYSTYVFLSTGFVHFYLCLNYIHIALFKYSNYNKEKKKK